ncbi:MAG: HEAT repeat domain-containing protein, partial [Nannocystaceae bacterium]
NSIRVLRDDGLRVDALRMYYAFVQIAEEFEEPHAAAIILREASDYCAKARLPYADIFRLRSGEMWLTAATAGEAKGMPAQLVESALTSAAEAFIGVRAFARTASVYERLLDVSADGGNAERYRRLRRRLGSSPSDELKPTPIPEHLRQRTEYEETWFVDPAEWELGGDPQMSAAGIIADRRYPDYVRRHALLTTLDLARFGGELGSKRLIQRLQMIRAYPILAVLEGLYETGGDDTKIDVARAVGAFRFKRSFMLLARMLRSESEGLRGAAESSMSGLFFPHAQDRLRKIFEARDLPSPSTTRSAAVRAIGRVNSAEALEFICDRLRDGDPTYVEQCRAAISRLTNPELASVLRAQA